MTLWWENAPCHILFGADDNDQEATWGGLERPPPDRLVELRFPCEDELHTLIGAPAHDALGRRRAIAVYGVEHMKAGARRLLRPLLDGGAFVVLFTHAPQALPQGVFSRCATMRINTMKTNKITELHARDADASVRIAKMPAGDKRRTALTALFQSGVTLATFLKAALTADALTSTLARRYALLQAAARVEHVALGSVNIIVHAEEFLTHMDH